MTSDDRMLTQIWFAVRCLVLVCCHRKSFIKCCLLMFHCCCFAVSPLLSEISTVIFDRRRKLTLMENCSQDGTYKLRLRVIGKSVRRAGLLGVRQCSRTICYQNSHKNGFSSDSQTKNKTPKILGRVPWLMADD